MKNQKVAVEVLLAGPKTAAQGILDVTEEMLPEPGRLVTVGVPLHRPRFEKTVGTVKLEFRA